MKLYGAPNTRAVRVAWLLEELALPYELARVEFKPTTDKFFIQDTPTGKIPTLEDGEVLLAESGAIVEYLLARYGDGRLMPPPDSAGHARALQWIHFAESTAFAPIGVVVWLTRYRQDADRHPALVDDARQRVQTTLEYVEEQLGGRDFLVDGAFSAADIMMGFTLVAAQAMGLLEPHDGLKRYVGGLLQRPALQRAVAKLA